MNPSVPRLVLARRALLASSYSGSGGGATTCAAAGRYYREAELRISDVIHGRSVSCSAAAVTVAEAESGPGGRTAVSCWTVVGTIS